MSVTTPSDAVCRHCGSSKALCLEYKLTGAAACCPECNHRPYESLAVSLDVIDALCRLNHHARAYGSGKRAIYHYKALASALLVVAGQSSVTLRQWRGRCDHCHGTGRYIDSYGEKFPHCRRCESTGMATLKFVECYLPNGHTWHHPWIYGQGGGDIAQLAGKAMWKSTDPGAGWHDANGNEPIFWNFQNGWTPHQPAERLPTEELAACLNIAELWVLDLQCPHDPLNLLRWMYERACAEMRRYSLDLGRIGEWCWMCGVPEIVTAFGHMGDFINWAAPICELHEKTPVALWPHKDAFLAQPLSPSLQQWYERHKRLGRDRDYERGWD